MRRQINWKIMLTSTTSIILVYVGLNLFRWLIMEIGAYFSGFEGDIIWNISNITAVSEHWTWSQVMLLYLAPYLAMLFLYAVVNWRRKYPVTIPRWLQLFQSWSFILLLLNVFFMPIFEILTKHGLYHALNWLGVGSILQYVFGIMMILFFVYSSFNLSTLTSTLLNIPNNKLITPKIVLIQLPYIWYIPIAILILVVFFSSNYIFPSNFLYFLSGLVFVMIINTWLISRYRVIVN